MGPSLVRLYTNDIEGMGPGHSMLTATQRLFGWREGNYRKSGQRQIEVGGQPPKGICLGSHRRDSDHGAQDVAAQLEVQPPRLEVVEGCCNKRRLVARTETHKHA